MAEILDISEEGLQPVSAAQLKDGEYHITVRSSSSMFHITDCVLKIKDGKMSADMTMGGTGYLYVYMGTGEEAAAAEETEYISFTKNADGSHKFCVPVEALDKELDCAAFSKKKEKWYDRKILFESASLTVDAFGEGMIQTIEEKDLSDGTHTIEAKLSGGTGKVSIESPMELIEKDGSFYVKLKWSSSHYDYMIIDGTRYDALNNEGGSEFLIPIHVLDHPMLVQADTTAMSTPHLIDYTITFDGESIH